VVKAAFLLFLVSLSFAVPNCPNYPHQDYTAASAYSPPVAPADTLLQYCNWNPSGVCLLSNAFNTTEDKKLFIAESIANGSFDQIWQWNQAIPFGKYPPNTSESSTNIKDAWVSIAYLNPSVYDNGTYRINDSTQPLIRQNFSFVVDTRQLPGDCNDHFRICGYDYSVSVQNTSSAISAYLKVWSEYLVDRYQWVTHCDLTGCWVTCGYYATDSFKDRLTVSNSKNILVMPFNPTSNYTVLAYFNNLTEIGINANDSNVLFQIGNSSFHKTEYSYGIRNEAGPYNVLVKAVIPANTTSAYGLSTLRQNGSNFTILAPYSGNCALTISGDFSSKTISGCDILNLSSSTKIQKVEPVQPAFFGSLFDAALLAIVVYVLYLIVKRVMPVA
jgi:hypothetical protein